MAIDRIGKGPGATTGLPSADRTTPAGPTTEAERPFEPRASGSASSREVAASQSAALGPLERLRAGEIDLPGYLDLKVEQATAHLRGLPRVELDALKEMLRDKLAIDPALIDLVRQATGAEPPAPDE